ncbi:uncharacterized protein TNCT_67291 [Trichonephila clavata]|nr:uncharacterized protein TNCT_67291 [Trichonephila clavata]
MDFVKINGCASFVFPSKETHLYLDVEIPREETWIWNDFMLGTDTSRSYFFNRKRGSATYLDECVTRNNILPFRRWEELVEERISPLLLPQLLQRELLDVVRSVSIEVDKWIKYHSEVWRKSPEIAHSFLYDFQWNSLGKIDLGKTARKLIINEKLEIEDRYILASLYSLMDKRPTEEKVPGEIVEMYSNFPERDTREQPPWIPFFAIQFNYSMQKDVFISASSKEKVQFLSTVLGNECLQFEDFLFFLSHMGEDERKTIFKRQSFKILRMYFLNWPLQCKFSNAAEQLLPFINKSEFREMLKFIIYERIMLDRKDFNYIDLLKEFWSLSPSKLKESIKTGSIYKSLMLIKNFPICEIFPNEQLLQNYIGNGLTFTYDGIKYICRHLIVKHYFEDASAFDPPRAFVNFLIFDKDTKSKYDQNACSGAK